MADLSKTVEIIFGGKNDVSKIVTDISRDFGQLDDLTSKVTEPLAKVGDSILKIDAALMALAIGGLALAVRESATFNQSFALISTSITATGDDLARYRNNVLDYSTTSVKSLDDINASLYTAAQAGVKYTESLDFIRKAEQLSVANNANLNTTVDLLTGTMNAYGFTLKDVGHLNDVFFQSTLIGKQTIDDLGVSMGHVVAIAANSGVSFEELSAAIATLTAKGMKTEDAITAVKNVITTIIAPSKEAETAATKLGLSFSLTELTAKGFSTMLQEIMTKTGGSKEKMVELFNEVRAMNGVLQLAGDGGKFFSDALEQIKNSSGAAEAAYNKMVATFSNQSQMLINTAKVTLIDIGTRIEPDAAKVAGSLASIFAGIKIGVDAGAFDQLFAQLDQVAGSLSAWFNGIAAAMPDALSKLDFSKLIAAFNDLGRAINDYLGGLDLTKADDLASAMQLLVDMVAGIVRVTAGMADAFRPFATAIVDFFKTLADGGPETQKTLGEILAFSKAIESMGLGIVGAIMAMDEFSISMRGVFDTVAGGVTILWNGLEIMLTAVKGLFLILEGLFVTFLDKLTFGMFPGLQALTADITKQGEQINASFAKNGEEARLGLMRLGDGLQRLGTETGTSRDRVKELRDRLTELPAETTTTYKLKGFDEGQAKVTDMTKALVALPDEKQIGIKVLADGSSIEKAYGLVIQRFPDGEPTVITNIGVYADEAKLTAVQKKIDTAIPKDKLVEIQAKLDEAKIKSQADIIQKSIEWKAKIDIADLESQTAKLKAMFESINTAITSTGTTLVGMFGVLNESAGKGTSWIIEEQIRKESDRRDKALEQQKELIEAEVAVLKQRAAAIEKGDGIIKIESSGLAPHLEAFMYEILAAIQVKANAEGMKFLVGV